MKYINNLQTFAKQALIYALTLQFVLLPQYGFSQTSGSTDPVLKALENSLVLESSKEISELTQKNAALTQAILSGDLSQYPQEYLDTYLLTNQSLILTESSENLSLLDNKEGLPTVTVDEIEPVIIDNKVHLQGINNKKVVASHIIEGIDAISIAQDPELIIIVDSKGSVHAIDKVFMVSEIFKSPLPVFKIVEQIKNFDEASAKNIELNFLTRGTKPFTEQELAQTVEKGQALLPINIENEVVFNSGDLVFYTQEANEARNFLAVYSRPMIHTIIERGTKYLTLLEFMYSHEGYGQNASEWRESILMIGNSVKNPAQELLDLFSSDERSEFEIWNKIIKENSTMNPNLVSFLKNIDRDQLKLGISASSSAASKSVKARDQFTYSQWSSSFEQIKDQAEDEIVQIKEKLKIAQAHQNNMIKGRIAPSQKYIESLSENAQTLTEQIENQDFSNISRVDGQSKIDYQELLKARVNGTFAFSHDLSPWYSKLTANKMKKIAIRLAKISAVITATAAGTAATLYLAEGLTLGDQFKLLVDLYDSSVFSLVRDGVPYYQTAIKGVVALLAFIPLANLFGQMMVPLLGAVKKMAPNGSNLEASLTKTIETYKPLTPWQRNITLSMRAYSRLLLPYYHKILKVFKQPTISVMRLGINPFKTVEISEKKRFLGFTNPFTSKAQREALAKEKSKAIFEMTQDAKNYKTLAWTLATIAVSQESGIDPATLTGLADQSLSLESFENILANPEAHKKWQLTANEFIDYLNKNNSHVNLKTISPDELSIYYKEVKKIAEKIKRNSKFKNSLIKLKHSFKNMGSGSRKALATYGIEDYNFLNTIVASPFVAEQTTREFVSDHLIVATLPTVAGERASMDHPELLAHEEHGFLFNSQQHMYDVANNTIAHLLMAGPATALVYQKVTAENTALYDSVDTYLLSSKARPEGFFKAAATWTKGVFNFKESNLGGYYLKGFFRRFTTLQASLTFTVFARIVIGGQAADVAMMAYALTWFAGVLTYGWPWTIISRGNQYLGENIGEQKGSLESVQKKIFNGIRNNNDDLISEGYKELIATYKDNYNASKGPMLKKLREIGKALDENIDIATIKAAMNSGENTKVYTSLAKAFDAYERGDYLAASKAITEAQSDPSILGRHRENITNNAALLLKESIVRPPVYTAANKAVPWMVTFGFGAVLTTYLAIGLMVESFTPEALTFSNIGSWAIKLAIFYPVVFALTSKYTWTKIGDSKMYNRLKKFSSNLCSLKFLK